MRTTRPAARSVVLARRALSPNVLALAALIALATFVLVARVAQAQTPTGTATPSGTATGTATATPARRLELAPIESVEVQVLKSQPPQYQLAVKSGLPGGCAQFNSISADRSGTRVEVTVWNSMPVGNVPCTAIYGYHDSTLNLGSDFAPGTTYTVVVNADSNRPMTTTFTTAAGGSAPGGTATPAVPQPANTGTGGLGTRVEAMDAIIGGSAMLAALLALSVLVVRVPRRRG